jgi:hypothetical protein
LKNTTVFNLHTSSTAPFSTPDQTDAVLLIGNEAMLFRSSPTLHLYDLGEIWLQKTGFPVVFAVFGVRKAILKAICPGNPKCHPVLSCINRVSEAGKRKGYQMRRSKIPGY